MLTFNRSLYSKKQAGYCTVLWNWFVS